MNPEDIFGWYDFDDIYDTAVASVEEGTFVEIGCWLGRSAAFMARKIKQSGKNIKFYCVDTFKGTPGNKAMEEFIAPYGGSLRAAFDKNIAACGLEVSVIEEPSELAYERFADKSLDFVFIDGDHSYEAVKKDIENWGKKLKPNGILAGHDYDREAVARAVKDSIKEFKVSGRSWISQSPSGL